MTYQGYWQNVRPPTNNQAVVGLYKGIANNIHYLFPQGAVAGAYDTFAHLAPQLRSRDIIVLGGVLREQAVAPLGVYDVTIIGAANRPRQATSGGVPTGGGATWLAPATGAVAATPLLELREQGWSIQNVMFNGPTDAACVKMHREETATYPDASHASFQGCRFSGFVGIEDYGGHSDVLIDDCMFDNLAGAGGGSIKVTNQGIAIPGFWLVKNSRFLRQVNGIVGAWVDSVFRKNTIELATTVTINSASGNVGLRNFWYLNHFNILAADFDPAGGITGNATDTWVSDLQDTREYGVPAN